MRSFLKYIFFTFLVVCVWLGVYAYLFNKQREEEGVSTYNKLLHVPFSKAFKDYYAPKLDRVANRKRSEGFAKIFTLAEEQSIKTNNSIVILETGSMRKSYLAFGGDGSSTLMFNHFVENKGGRVYTVDLNDKCKNNIENIYKLKNTYSYIMDSVEYLKNFQTPQDITVLYLDSYDVDFNKPEPSARHHLKEIEVIFDKLTTGTIIAIDDNKVINGEPRGKGYLVEKFLRDKNTKLIYDGYIKVFQIQR